MIDYSQTVKKIITSITELSFEYDYDTLKKEMKLEEVSPNYLKELGVNKVIEKFNQGVFKIKMEDGAIIDVSTLERNNVDFNFEEPIIFKNPSFKYVQWVIKKDFTTPQIKKRIKNQLTNNTDINLAEVQKVLMIQELQNKQNEGYIGGLGVKSSNYVSEGKFYIQSSCAEESAIKMVYEVIEELKSEKQLYVAMKIKRDFKHIVVYSIFVLLVSSLWLINKQYQTIPIRLSNTFGLVLFLIPLVIMRLINHSMFDALFYRNKTKRKYEKEFDNKVF